MNKYCTLYHARELSGIVAFVTFNCKEKYTEDTIFDKVMSLSQMDGLLSDPEWTEWAKQIVYSAFHALTYYPVVLDTEALDEQEAQYEAMNF